MNVAMPLPRISAEIAKDIEHMATVLVRGHDDIWLDFGDERQVDDWLEGEGFSKGQILACGEQALDAARAKLQVRAGIDNVACTVGLVMGGVALWLFLIGFTGPADAAILSPAALDAGADAWLLILGVICGLFAGHWIGWLQYGKRVKLCAPYPDEDDHGVGAFDYRNARQ